MDDIALVGSDRATIIFFNRRSTGSLPLKEEKKKNSRKIFYPVTNGKRLYYVLNFFRQNYAQLKDFKYPIAQLTWKYL